MVIGILYSVALLALIAASFTDLKTREVPDWISYGLIAAALGLRLMFSLAAFEWVILLQGLAGFLIFVAFGYLMYYTGQWGGGDSKLIMGLGAVIGFNTTLAVFFINVLVAGGVYGLFWIIALAWLHASAVKKEMKSILLSARVAQYAILSLTVVLIILTLAVSNGNFMRFAFMILSLLPLFSFYLWVAIKSVEKVALYKQVHPKELTEGDWLAHDIVVNGKCIAGKKDLGITKAQIGQLTQLYKQKKIKHITVKNGIPFVPSFLIGFLITIVFGNWVQALL